MTSSAAQRISLSRLRGANNEGVLALILLGLIIVMSLLNPTFFSVSTLFAIVRSSIVPLIFALGVLLVIISGGIDVSFAAIAIFAGYTTVTAFGSGGFGTGLVGAVLLALAIGAALGFINGVVIARFRLPTLIVTLGTQGIIKGALLTFVGSRFIADLPTGDRRAVDHQPDLGCHRQRSCLPACDDHPRRPAVLRDGMDVAPHHVRALHLCDRRRCRRRRDAPASGWCGPRSCSTSSSG